MSQIYLKAKDGDVKIVCYCKIDISKNPDKKQLSCHGDFIKELIEQKLQNYGCLPSPYRIITMYQKHNAIWGCHNTSEKENNLIPCKGFLEFTEENPDLGIKIKGNEIIIDYERFETEEEYYNKFKIT